MNTAILTIAVGEPMWGEMALNLCLSIKANDSNQKVGLIYTDGAVESVKPMLNNHFNYGTMIYHEGCKSNAELAFKTKTQLHDIASKMCPDADAFIFMDADTILLPDKSPQDWFDKHSQLNFTCYCNDFYHYSTGERKRKDYTFWGKPEEIKERYNLDRAAKLPQINSSWLYWKNNVASKKVFDTAKEVWEDDYDGVMKYRDAKPDEFCFNVACAKTGIYPHKNTYRPMFFQCFSENFSPEYVHHFFKGFGFAGNAGNHDHIIDLYNNHATYYRNYFGVVSKFKMQKETKAFEDKSPMPIYPFRRRTLYRAGEVIGSEGGIFNPDGVIHNGQRITIFRKEGGMDAYMRYKTSTAKPHVHILSATEEKEIELKTDFWPTQRLEDFRLFSRGEVIMCNHHVVMNNHTDNMAISVRLSHLDLDGKFCGLVSYPTPRLPIETKKIEKNWVFFSEGNVVYCIYSLKPYRVFGCASLKLEIWDNVDTTEPDIQFVHGGAISNSTNPIRIGDHYLMFFHTKEAGIYYKGALLIDAATKNISHYTRNTLPFIARNDGMHKALHYISGCMLLENPNEMRVFYGENDSHACCVDYKVDEFMEVLLKHPV